MNLISVQIIHTDLKGEKMSQATDALKAAADLVVGKMTELKGTVDALTVQVQTLSQQVTALQASQEDAAAIGAVTTELTAAAQ